MPHVVKTIAIGFVLAVVAGWLWRRWRKAQRQAQRAFAILQFEDLRDALQDEFLAAAAASGKPRGLSWRQCDLQEDELFALDRVTGELYALVGATVSFEAVAGGDMEDVEAVGNLRFATAVFVHRRGEWTTDGRVVFNLEPAQALERYRESLSPLASPRSTSRPR